MKEKNSKKFTEKRKKKINLWNTHLESISLVENHLFSLRIASWWIVDYILILICWNSDSLIFQNDDLGSWWACFYWRSDLLNKTQTFKAFGSLCYRLCIDKCGCYDSFWMMFQRAFNRIVNDSLWSWWLIHHFLLCNFNNFLHCGRLWSLLLDLLFTRRFGEVNLEFTAHHVIIHRFLNGLLVVGFTVSNVRIIHLLQR